MALESAVVSNRNILNSVTQTLTNSIASDIAKTSSVKISQDALNAYDSNDSQDEPKSIPIRRTIQTTAAQTAPGGDNLSYILNALADKIIEKNKNATFNKEDLVKNLDNIITYAMKLKGLADTPENRKKVAAEQLEIASRDNLNETDADSLAKMGNKTPEQIKQELYDYAATKGMSSSEVDYLVATKLKMNPERTEAGVIASILCNWKPQNQDIDKIFTDNANDSAKLNDSLLTYLQKLDPATRQDAMNYIIEKLDASNVDDNGVTQQIKGGDPQSPVKSFANFIADNDSTMADTLVTGIIQSSDLTSVFKIGGPSLGPGRTNNTTLAALLLSSGKLSQGNLNYVTQEVMEWSNIVSPNGVVKLDSQGVKDVAKVLGGIPKNAQEALMNALLTGTSGPTGQEFGAVINALPEDAKNALLSYFPSGTALGDSIRTALTTMINPPMPSPTPPDQPDEGLGSNTISGVSQKQEA